MCTVCGCGNTDEGAGGGHAHDHHGHDAHPPHGHEHVHHRHNYGAGDAGVSVAGFSQNRLIEIERNILSKNDQYAAANRAWFAERGILALNLVSSPGAGKTTLLVETLKALHGQMPASVIEGDQDTANDADRIRETGAQAVQINTGKGCHLDAHMVGHALESLSAAAGGVVFIENVGNLVCPAAFDLGEAHKVVILSVTEGEDKPIKYPDMFAAADLMILSKIDLLPHLDFDAGQAIEYAHRVNPALQVLRVSAKTAEGMAEWQRWIVSRTPTADTRAQPTDRLDASAG